MGFGAIFKAKRLEMGFDLKALSQKSGLSMGFISLTENDKTRITMASAIRLSDALNVELEQLYSGYDPYLYLYQDNNQEDFSKSPFITIPDIKNYILMFLSDPIKANGSVKNWLVHALDISTDKDSENDMFKLTKFSLTDTQDFDSRYFFSAFNNIADDLAFKIFSSSGVIDYHDIGIHFKNARKNKMGITQIELEQITGISDSVQSRIEHGNISEIKLEDIIKIGEALDEPGLSLLLAWNATQFETGMFLKKDSDQQIFSEYWNAYETKNKLIHLLVRASRWLYIKNPDEFSKIRAFRSELKQLNGSEGE